jgi:hypothetical protein
MFTISKPCGCNIRSPTIDLNHLPEESEARHPTWGGQLQNNRLDELQPILRLRAKLQRVIVMQLTTIVLPAASKYY